MTDTIDRCYRELADAQRWGSRLYPCAVALTSDQEDEMLFSSTGNDYTRFDDSGSLTLFGLPIAIVPDTWKGPLILLASKD